MSAVDLPTRICDYARELFLKNIAVRKIVTMIDSLERTKYNIKNELIITLLIALLDAFANDISNEAVFHAQHKCIEYVRDQIDEYLKEVKK